jgi:hypothetical protein
MCLISRGLVLLWKLEQNLDSYYQAGMKSFSFFNKCLHNYFRKTSNNHMITFDKV